MYDSEGTRTAALKRDEKTSPIIIAEELEHIYYIRMHSIREAAEVL